MFRIVFYLNECIVFPLYIVYCCFYRYKQECGYSQDSSDDMGEWRSSPGGGTITPSTPGCGQPLLMNPLHQNPYRRGSLPCDFSFSGMYCLTCSFITEQREEKDNFWSNDEFDLLILNIF